MLKVRGQKGQGKDNPTYIPGDHEGRSCTAVQFWKQLRTSSKSAQHKSMIVNLIMMWTNLQAWYAVQERQAGTSDVQEVKELIDVQPPKGAALYSSSRFDVEISPFLALLQRCRACLSKSLMCAGTRDFGPDEHRLKQWLFGHFESVSRLFGFEQFETPVLESEELFVRKAGEEITQQLYNFEVASQLHT